MNPHILKKLSLVNAALSSEYRGLLVSLSELEVTKTERVLNYYSSFVFLTKPSGYKALDILSSSSLFNQHCQEVVGFIYCQGWTMENKYSIATAFLDIMENVAEDKALEFSPLSTQCKSATKDVEQCIDLFNTMSVDSLKHEYLKGYQIVSQDDKAINVYLDPVYVVYGRDFALKVHLALVDYGRTLRGTTLANVTHDLAMLFESMTKVCGEIKKLEVELSSKYVQSFFHNVMTVWFSSVLVKQHDPKVFFKMWSNAIKHYKSCFIDTGILDAPVKEFIVPSWKSPLKAPSISIGGKATRVEKQSWFADIPLRIKDEQAVSIIKSKVDRNICHIKHAYTCKFQKLKEIEHRNTHYRQVGVVKPLVIPEGQKSRNVPTGSNNLANCVATFYTHGIGRYKKKPAKFFRFESDTNALIEELNLPTTSTLAVLCTLLVIEHPKITPAWLKEWELFDKNGKQTGFFQSGNQHMIVSVKPRRGVELAEQAIVLNEFSLEVVKFMVTHTSIARQFLKSRDKSGWRKMVLTATLSSARPRKTMSCIDRAHDVTDSALFTNKSPISQSEANELAQLINLRSVRRHRGLQIYLETRSVIAVSEALGHSKVHGELMETYLPEPLIDFFNERWVRQFQNAILLQAMEGSRYCLDSVDLSVDEIEEFLKNHGLSDLPTKLDYGFKEQNLSSGGESDSYFDEATYVVSISLLQLLIAIKSIYESEDKSTLVAIAKDWYQSASFILNLLVTEQYSADKELSMMLKEATSNPLDLKIVTGALRC